LVHKQFRIQEQLMQFQDLSFFMNLFEQERPNGTGVPDPLSATAILSALHLSHGT
jgi:hypothetical protein